MNCLAEAIGLALPGNGSVLATHTARRALYENAGRTVVDITKRYYEQDDAHRPAAQHRHPRGLRQRHGPGHRHGRLDQHDPAPARRRAGGRGWTTTWTTSTPSPAACPACPRSRRTSRPAARTTWRTSTAPAASPPSSASCTAAACSTRTCTPSTRAGIKEWLGELGRAGRHRRPTRPSSCGTRRPAASVPPRPSRSPSAGTPSTRRGGRLHPRRGARVLGGRRPGRPEGQPRRGRLCREDGRRRRVDLDLRGPGRRLRIAGGRRRQDPHASRSRRATSSSSATRAPRAAPACRRCSTRRRSSRAAAWARPARWSRTAASPAARPACRSATPRPRRRRAARSRSSRTATASASTSRTAAIDLLVDDEELAARREALGGVYAPKQARTQGLGGAARVRGDGDQRGQGRGPGRLAPRLSLGAGRALQPAPPRPGSGGRLPPQRGPGAPFRPVRRLRVRNVFRPG